MSPRTGSGDRIAALDGLRGFAALAVVVHHCMIVSPTILNAFSQSTHLSRTSWEWWALYTPLHLLWAGDEAVIVFFVLSGFVLTLPFLGGAVQWPDYYVRRVIRLYLPVWGALVVTVASLIAVPRVATAVQSRWVHERAVQVTAAGLVGDASLARPTSVLDGVLWSLHYELLFSLLLPAYLLLGFVLRRWWAVKLGLLVALVVAGNALGFGPLRFLPVFAVGVVLACERERIGRWAAARSTWQWVALFGLAGFLLIARWLDIPVRSACSVVAAAVLVVGFQSSKGARRVGEARVPAWLGKRSFSLYLVHEPVVVTVAVLTAATSPLWPLLIGLPASLAAAAGLYVLVERPSHRLARRAGHAVSGVRRRSRTTAYRPDGIAAESKTS